MFEKINGSSSYFFESDLKKALEVTDCNRLDFAVVASCHSENAGKVFNAAGVKHVICIKKDKKMLDRLAHTFARIFYNSVFCSNVSIC
jgi:hypothetical protein